MAGPGPLGLHGACGHLTEANLERINPLPPSTMNCATRRHLSVLAIAFALGGCAATVDRSSPDRSLIAPSPEAARNVVMYLNAPAANASGEDWEAFVDEWRTSMAASTAAAGLTFSLAPAGSPTPPSPATVVRLKVNDFKYVSQAKRYAIGVLSGNASMDVDAEFTEAPSGRLLGTRKYATSSNAWHGVFAAMTPKQVEAVSQEIVREIKAR